MEQKRNLTDLPNIGKVVAGQLTEVGITTPEELKEIGATDAWLRIQEIDQSACINRLFGLEGAILEIKKAYLPPERKAQLKEFYEEHKIKGAWSRS